MDSEDSDQTGRMPRLIWVFAGRTATFLVLPQGGSIIRLFFGMHKHMGSKMSYVFETLGTNITWKLFLLCVNQYMSLVTRKPVFGVCDQVRLKLTCAAKEARKRLEISDIETRDMILSRRRITKVLIRLRRCAG